jgi:hypothetical protein
MKEMSAKIKKNPLAFEEFAKMIDSDEFKQLILLAARDPTSAAAKQVLSKVLPILSFGTKRSVVGCPTDTLPLLHAMAMSKRYNAGCTFLTITPNDVNSPQSLCLALGSNDNSSFLSVVTPNFFEALRRGDAVFSERSASDAGTILFPIDYKARVKAASQNPVAVALKFQRLVENVLSVLIGCKPTFRSHNNSKDVRTWCFKDGKKGIFGCVTAFFGMMETQQRGALHFHVIIWGGIAPKLLEKAACTIDDGGDDPSSNKRMLQAICLEVQKALDTMCTACLPRRLHLEDHLLKR